MATTEKTIDIIFAGVDKASSTIEKVGKGLGALSDFTKPLADLTKGILAIETALGAVAVAILQARSAVEKETLKMEAAFGIPVDKAKELADVARNLYGQSFADSIEGGAEAVRQAFAKFGDDSTVDLERVSQKALAFQGLFEVDVAESITAVKTLMTNFGLSSDEAFNLLTKGIREGLNGSDDLFESIGEFSTQFSEAGYDAAGFFGVMDSGYEAGVLGTDKAADAIKEFRLKILEMSDDVKEALEAVGIDSEAMAKAINDGTITSKEAFDKVYTAINNTAGISDRFRAGQTLIGTQWEDLAKKAGNLDTVGEKYKNLGGESDNLVEKFREMGRDFSSVWRAVVNEVEKLGIWDKFYGEYKESITKIVDNLPEAFAGVDFSGVEKVLEDLKETLKGFFGDADITTVEWLQKVIQSVVDTYVEFQKVANGVLGEVKPLFDFIINLVTEFNKLDEETKKTIGQVLAFGTATSSVAGVLASGAGFVANVLSATAALGGGAGAGGGLAAAAAAAAGPLALGALGIAIFTATGYLVDKLNPAVEETAKEMNFFSDFTVSATGKVSDITDKTQKAVEKLKDFENGLNRISENEKTEKRLDAIKEGMKELEDEFNKPWFKEKTDVVLGLNTDEFKKELDTLVRLNSSTRMEASLHVNEKSFADGAKFIVDALPSGELYFEATASPDKKSIAKTKEEIEKEIPALKRFEIQSELDIAKINADADRIETAMEVKASVDIAEIEAAAATTEAAFESITATVEQTGTQISDLFGAMEGLGKSASDTQRRWQIEEQLEKENELRMKQFELQEKLIQSQVDYNKAKEQRLQGGQPLINVTVDPAFQPAAGEILRSLIEMAQVQANEFGLEALGVS